MVAAAGIAFLPAGLRAQPQEPRDRRRVLLLVDAPGDPFMARIRAEIASIGLEVVVRPPQGPIESSARAEHAVAAIRMLPSRNGVEVWMADETSGRSLLRQAIVDETVGGPNQNLIALQTAELLRTSLFPREPTNRANPDVAPPVIVHVPSPPSSTESAVSSGVGLLYGAGGASPSWQAWLSFQHLWSRGLGLALTVSAPLRRGTMSAREGTADVGAVVAGAEVLARFESERRRMFLTTGLGAAFVSVFATGHPIPEANAQLSSTSSVAYTALGYGRIVLGWRVSSWLALGMSGLAGTTAARVQVRFAGNDVGDWGVPVLGAALFGAVDWR
jgi:hypothetical protein